MKRYLLDTGIMGDFINHRCGVDERAREVRTHGARIGTCMPVVCELFFGIEQSKTRNENMKRLNRALTGIPCWPLTREAAEEYGRLAAELRRIGRPMQSGDIMIAAIARTLGDCTLSVPTAIYWPCRAYPWRIGRLERLTGPAHASHHCSSLSEGRCIPWVEESKDVEISAKELVFRSAYEDLRPAIRRTVAIADSLLKLLENVVGLPADFLNHHLGRFRQRYKELVESIHRALPPFRVGCGVLKEVAYSADEPNLQEMFAQLLATASDKRGATIVHPGFASIINQLLPLDAKILAMVASGTNDDYRPKTDYRMLIHETREGDEDSMLASLDNLVRLGLLKPSPLLWPSCALSTRTNQEVIPLADAAKSNGRNGTSLRVLVVEDYADCAQSTAMLLRKYGHDVAIAESGPRALALVQAQRPDVVLLDIGLPGMDGWELAKRIKTQTAEKKLWLIAVTGYGREVDARHSAESGIDVHLTKPVEPEKLKSLLNETLGNHFRPTEYSAGAPECEAYHGQASNETPSPIG